MLLRGRRPRIAMLFFALAQLLLLVGTSATTGLATRRSRLAATTAKKFGVGSLPRDEGVFETVQNSFHPWGLEEEEEDLRTEVTILAPKKTAPKVFMQAGESVTGGSSVVVEQLSPLAASKKAAVPPGASAVGHSAALSRRKRSAFLQQAKSRQQPRTQAGAGQAAAAEPEIARQAGVMLRALQLVEAAATTFLKGEATADDAFALGVDPALARAQLQRTNTSVRRIAHTFDQFLLLAQRIKHAKETGPKQPEQPTILSRVELAQNERLRAEVQRLKRDNRGLKADAARSQQFLRELREQEDQACSPPRSRKATGLLSDSWVSIADLGRENRELTKRVGNASLAFAKESTDEEALRRLPSSDAKGSPSSLAALRNAVAALEAQNTELASDNEGLRSSLSNAAVLNPGKQMQRQVEEAQRDTDRRKAALTQSLQDLGKEEKALEEQDSGLVDAGRALRTQNQELGMQNKELQLMLARSKQEQTDLDQDKEDLATRGNAALLEQDRLLTTLARVKGLEEPRLSVRPAVDGSTPTSRRVSETGMEVPVSPAATRGPLETAAALEKPEQPMPNAAGRPMHAMDNYLMDAQINPEKEQEELEWPKNLRPAAFQVLEMAKPKAEKVTLKEALAMTSFEEWVHGRIPAGAL